VSPRTLDTGLSRMVPFSPGPVRPPSPKAEQRAG